MAEGLSLKELRAEHASMCADYEAFTEAYDRVRQRIQESGTSERLVPLHRWSGTSAVMGSLELAINAIRRTIEEYADLIYRVEGGQIPNTDEPERPRLALVEEPHE